jgi:hypothetical protein
VAKPKISKEQRQAIRNAKKLIDQAMKMNGNEAETRRRVERIFGEVMGYDVFKHLSRERAVSGAGETEHVDFAIQLEPGPDAQPIVMVELKRVGSDLTKKHLKQVTSYAIDAGCEWILLTNGREWQIYHVEFGQPPVTELLKKWNLLEDDIAKLGDDFESISYKSVRRGLLNEMWNRMKVLAPTSLLAAIVNNDTFRIIRRNLRKDTGVSVDDNEIYKGIRRLLNEASGKAMSNISLPKPKSSKHSKKKKEKGKELSEFGKVIEEPEHLRQMREEFEGTQDKENK